jgi:hypothetical protein
MRPCLQYRRAGSWSGQHIRYHPESGLVMLTVSFVGPDPKPTWSAGCFAQARRHA